MKSEGSSRTAAVSPLDPSLLQRVLLIRLRSIGDTVLMTPCLAAIKEFNPEAHITVVSEPLSAPVLEDHPLVDKLLVTTKKVSSRVSVIRQARRARFDAAFNMHGGSTGAILTRLSGAGAAIGYRGLRSSWMLRHRAPAPDVILGRSRIHSVEQQLALLEWAGAALPASRPRLVLTVSPEARTRVSERLEELDGDHQQERSFACIVPGAAFESKRWGADGFAAVADHLRRRWDLPSIVVAGPGQENLAREVARGGRRKMSVLTDLSLKELIALLDMAHVFVGNDSGPMHIAAALERPLVAVWGSSDPAVWHPWTEAPYRMVGGREGGDDPQGQVRGIKQTPASEVTAAVDDVLELALEANHKASVSV